MFQCPGYCGWWPCCFHRMPGLSRPVRREIWCASSLVSSCELGLRVAGRKALQDRITSGQGAATALLGGARRRAALTLACVVTITRCSPDGEGVRSAVKVLVAAISERRSGMPKSTEDARARKAQDTG